jgi:ATP-dependent DNA helicase DinG
MTLESLLLKNDGTGRQLRQGQVDALTWVHKNWKSNNHLILQAGVGAGKSNIIKSMQDYFGGNIVTSQNALIEQYVKDYPQLNKVIGRQHYKCHVEGGSCGYYSMAKSCRGDAYLPCPLKKSRENIKTHSIFNAMSAFMLRKQYKVSGGINYVDEAHTLLSMVRLMGTHTIVPQKQLLKRAGINRTELNNELKVIKYLETKRDRLLELSGKDIQMGTKEKHEAEIENINFTIDCLENSPELYVIQEKDGRVYVFPLKAPRFVLDKIIGHTGVLTSATMVHHDIVELLGREEYPFLSLRSEIPAANRPVVLHKSARNMAQDQTSPRYIAELIADIYEKNRVSTMVHVTYSMAEQISQHLKVPHLIHGKEDKKEVLASFLEKGGVLLGAGMAEGLDLKDDLCRQQIIVKIQFPNYGDMWVQKRKALLDGETWYAAEAYKIFAQQVGRSTRHKNDYSITHVLDSRLPRVVQQWDKLGILPDYLKESIQL